MMKRDLRHFFAERRVVPDADGVGPAVPGMAPSPPRDSLARVADEALH